jgi:hypothetical protein
MLDMHYIVMIPKEIEDLLHECNVYVNKDAVAVVQVLPEEAMASMMSTSTQLMELP